MATRTARTAWSGSVAEGTGEVELVSSGLGTFHVSFPKRAADDPDSTTSPEELIGAALSSCYSMQLSALIAEAGGTPGDLEVRADVGFGPDPGGGFHIPGIQLTVRGNPTGLDAARFAEVAEDAKRTCPVSKALTGVAIRVEASLD